jgi:Na+/melibiose symporter-like transporter
MTHSLQQHYQNTETFSNRELCLTIEILNCLLFQSKNNLNIFSAYFIVPVQKELTLFSAAVLQTYN